MEQLRDIVEKWSTLRDIWRRAAFTASRVFLLLSTDSGTAGSFLAGGAVVSFGLYEWLKIIHWTLTNESCGTNDLG